MEKICDPIAKMVVGSKWLRLIDEEETPLSGDPKKLKGEYWNDRFDLLIDTEHYYQILTGESKRLSPNLMIVESKFGWFVHGLAADDQPAAATTVSLLILANNLNQETPMQLLGRLFEMDRV